MSEFASVQNAHTIEETLQSSETIGTQPLPAEPHHPGEANNKGNKNIILCKVKNNNHTVFGLVL